MTHRRSNSSARAARACALWACTALAACAPRGSEDDAVARGDLAYASGNVEAALAEYQLAVRQGDDAEAYARVGHTYAQLGQVDEAHDYYVQAADRDPRWADQAGSDLLHLAREAEARSDRFLMASAVETALIFLPGLSVEGLALPLARHYFQSGEFVRALPFYQKALNAVPDSAADVVMEVGTAYEEVGDCSRALSLFERYREMVQPWERTEVDWHIGNCSLSLGRQRRAEDLPDEALLLVDRTLEVGEPKNLIPQTWFERGEILSQLGRCDEALDAYRRVRALEPTGTGALVRRAEERIDEVRFGRDLQGLTGRCGA
jgi:tetratricopeptide (TPR) repeat protein